MTVSFADDFKFPIPHSPFLIPPSSFHIPHWDSTPPAYVTFLPQASRLTRDAFGCSFLKIQLGIESLTKP